MYLDTSLLVNSKKFEGIEKDITCPICQGIINDQYFCNKCQNNFCSKCINKWKYNNAKCPFRCLSPIYIQNKFLTRIFSELLKFKCQKGCDEIISYNNISTHFENCKNENFKEKYYESATKVEILKVQLEDLNDIKEELYQTKNELEEIKERNTELENELEEVKNDRNDYENRNNELIEENEELENTIENEKCKYGILKIEMNKLIEEKDNVKIELNEEKEKNAKLEDKINLLQKEKDNIEQKEKVRIERINELENIIRHLIGCNNNSSKEKKMIKTTKEKGK
jgi:DNA repair exonuclease SbcCD ATPase subunit